MRLVDSIELRHGGFEPRIHRRCDLESKIRAGTRLSVQIPYARVRNFGNVTVHRMLKNEQLSIVVY